MQDRTLTGAFTYYVHIGIPMNALLRFVQDEYPDATNDELLQLARSIFDDTPAYLKEIDHLLNPTHKDNECSNNS